MNDNNKNRYKPIFNTNIYSTTRRCFKNKFLIMLVPMVYYTKGDN